MTQPPKQEVLIVTGPPVSGKSTLVEDLAHEGFTPVAGGGYKADPLWEALFRVDQRPRRSAFDTLHLLPALQGTLDGTGDPFGDVGRRMVERYLLSRRATAVVCFPPYKDALEVWDRRDGLWALQKETVDYYPLYHAWMTLREFSDRHAVNTDLPLVWFDWTQDAPGGVVERAREVRPPQNRGPGIGHYRRGVTLIVGERPNLTHHLSLPFVDNEGTGPWFTERLEEAGIPERDLYWINARRRDGRETDPWFLDHLEPERVVALGNTAVQWARRRGLKQETLPRPEYWRKVKYTHPYPLEEAFK